ncbi:alcohol dehydrogenase [Trichoderma cornu-damae]|uniref:Alcohol dehydrogenase n=1 Tax=Trichoderma cornu-damae TaxID=654480 RepID=A0A9P8QXW0_9HYPO|nr:alcohol dehydrogenase [Trichoderma cornu-damae]
MTSSLPETYKAVVLPGPNSPFTLQDVPLKHPPAGHVLVKVLACGVCWSDMELAHGNFGNVFPRTPGHEIVGDIAELGAGVENLAVGQRVGGPWHGGHDGVCRECRRGEFQYCRAAAVNGVSRDGGFAEYALLRAEAVVRIPSQMDPAQAAPLLCAGVTVFNGIRKQRVEQGRLVAVQGLGGLGHLAVQYASKMGYEVAVLSHGDDKAAFARQLGAHHFINAAGADAVAELARLGGASIIVQTAPSAKVVGALVDGLAPNGTILSLAPVGSIDVNTVTLIMKGAGVQGWASGHALDSEEAIQFALTHGVKCMVERYPFGEVQKAIDSLEAGKPRFRNVLVMQ